MQHPLAQNVGKVSAENPPDQIVNHAMVWGSNVFRHLNGVGPRVAAPDEEVPPAVVLARAELAGFRSTSSAGSSDPVADEFAMVNPVTGRVDDNAWTVVTEAGEVRKKARRDGPWVQISNPERLKRGSAHLALSIARSDARSAKAIQNFEELVFADTTSAAKNSMFDLWARVCRTRGWQPIPVTCESLMHVAAILREAGFKSVANYLHEARDLHGRAGFTWTPPLQAALQDVKRASKRAIGHTKRSDEVCPEVWEALADLKGIDPVCCESASDAPAGGIALWMVGTLFLLREVELGCLLLDSETIQMSNIPQRAITVNLSASKSDPAGKGAKRTLVCNCGASVVGLPVRCPFHMMKKLVDLQLARLGFDKIEDVPIGAYTLVAQRRDPLSPVTKQAMIAEAQRLVTMARDLVFIARDLSPENTTGHFTRRSGAKLMARMGCSFSCIQWFARHSSAITWIYVEEAWAESPRDSWRMADELAIRDMIGNVLTKVNSVDEALKIAEKKFQDSLDSMEMLNTSVNRVDFNRDVRKALIPTYVINLGCSKIHVVQRSACNNADTRLWATKCGWNWLKSGQACKPVFEDDEVDKDDFFRCLKCFSEG